MRKMRKRAVHFVWNFVTCGAWHYVKSAHIRGFSGPNAGKNGPEKLRIRTLFTQCDTFKKKKKKTCAKNLKYFLPRSERWVMASKLRSKILEIERSLIASSLLLLPKIITILTRKHYY